MPLSRLLNWKRLRRTPEPPLLRPSITSSVSLAQSGSVAATLTIPRVSFTGTITPTITGLPSGVSYVLSPTTLDSATLSTTVTFSATAGATVVSNQSYTVTCTGTGVNQATTTGLITTTATVTPAISISADKSSTTAQQGQTDSFNVTLARTNYTGDVTIAVSGLPTGASATISPNPLTGATLVAGVVITNTAGASTVTNDAYTVGATGSGVSAATNVNMTHTITSPTVSRGVFNYSSVVKGSDFQSFADTAALLAEVPNNETNASKLKLLTVSADATGASSAASCISLAISPVTGLKVMRITLDNTHGPPNSTQMWFASYPGMPTTNRTGGVSTAFTDVAVYSEVSYSAGFTTGGSDSGGQGFKQYAVGYANAYGRFGLEWEYVTSNTYTIGWNNNGNGNFGDVGSNGSTTISPNGDVRPWSPTGASGIWVVPQVMCFYTEMRTVDSNTVTQKSWSWLKGSNPTTNPQLSATVNCGGGSLPTVDRVAWCENFNMRRGYRYMPDGGYIDYHFIGVVDLTYDSNPCNL